MYFARFFSAVFAVGSLAIVAHAANAPAANNVEPSVPSFDVEPDDLYWEYGLNLESQYTDYVAAIRAFHNTDDQQEVRKELQYGQLLKYFAALKSFRRMGDMPWKKIAKKLGKHLPSFEGETWEKESIDLPLFMNALGSDDYKKKIKEAYIENDGDQNAFEERLLQILKEYRKEAGTNQMVILLAIAGGILGTFIVGAVVYYFVMKRRAANKASAALA